MLILTNQKQDEIFILMVKQSREDTGDVHCTGMALCRTGEKVCI